MTDREALIYLCDTNNGYIDEWPAEDFADYLIANNVIIQKQGSWILHDDGDGTCDQCHFRQKHIWDVDNSQNFCGVCGAKMYRFNGR